MSRFWRWLVLALVVPLLAAACGGSSTPKVPPPPVPAATNKAPKAEQRHDCHFAPAGSPHAAAAREGLACPSPSQKIKAFSATAKDAQIVYMADSTDAGYLPGGYFAYAGYCDGLYTDLGNIFGRFPGVGSAGHIIGITVYGNNCRDVDLEPSPSPFQNNPYSAGGWAHQQIYGGGGNPRPIIYTMASWQGQIEDSLAQWGIPRCSTPTQLNCYLEWIASWDYVAALDIAHAAAKQYAPDGPNGENYDRSILDASMIFAAPGPPPPPPDPNYVPSFNWGYASGVAGTYKIGYSKDHALKTESGPWNQGWIAGHAHAKAAGQTARHRVPRPLSWNTSWTWGFDWGYADGQGGTFKTWFGVLYAHPFSVSASQSGFQVGFGKGFTGAFRAGYLADKVR